MTQANWFDGWKAGTNFFRGLLMVLGCLVSCCDGRNVARSDYEAALRGSDLDGASAVGALGYSVELAILEPERDQLSAVLETFAAEHGLRFFDFERSSPSFSSRRMALFSARGLHVHADMVTGNQPSTRNVPRSPIILVGVTFANHAEWQPVLRALDTTLRAKWSDKAGPESLNEVKPIEVPDLRSRASTWS